MTDHKAAEAAFNKGMADRSDNHNIEYNSGEDKAVYPSTPDRLRFAQKDGDDGDLRLAMKSKKPDNNSRMPSADTDVY